MHKLIVTAKAKTQLKKLSKSHQTAVSVAIQELKEDPFLGKPLKEKLTGRLTFQVGIYRIIYSVNEQEEKVTIFNIDHRAVVYK